METIIPQMVILTLFLIYILASISFKKFRNKIYRACAFIFIIAGLVSYVMNGSSWIDFLGVIVPLVVLYQFEDRFTK
ncbi:MULTISPECIES: hypothetical protein [Streptococcus]|uniref:Uncharacterized protein n=2 Tax=Streptococcus suis TaxID=1307 RepID=A0A3Q8B5Y0_STRSU|nr:hypothetical protein [Streptococcus suis]AER19563.1 hypothetical protein SSUD12_1275 [Streptococcus suis D12]ASW49869.1 hypothetical protein A7J08_06120 [Streptococcus suis]KPA71722.1 hypothetical protein WQ51_07120 [Streptococcus suis]MBM0195698.1 hypothetical protein [Streptococcus suis]MBM7316956.1 hypothetical protein [Streptococcus suis]